MSDKAFGSDDTNNNLDTNYDSNEYTLLKLLIEELNKNNSKADNSINTVTTLWIILFALIIAQKVFKYIAKPLYRSYSAVTTRRQSAITSSDSDDSLSNNNHKHTKHV